MEFIKNLRESRLKSYSSTPGDIEEHRRAEYRVAADTAGRPLIELLQNADDALQLTLNLIRRAVRIILNQQRLLIANDGEPFSPEGVEAICNLDRSPKKDRRITIGNKGIGFKSVLLWTMAPSIFSSTFQFTFDREKSAEAISKTIGNQLFPIELGGRERQQRAKLLFGMTPVSEKVSETVTTGNGNNHKTEGLNQKFEKIKPVLLARLSKERQESRDKDKELLQSIKLKAFDGLRQHFHIIESEVLLSEESAIACWSDNGKGNNLLLNMEESEKRLWSSTADALAQRFGRTYYEVFKVLLLSTSYEEIIDELRHAGISAEDIRSCEDVLKGKPPLPIHESKGLKGDKKETDDTVQKEEDRQEIKATASSEKKESKLITPQVGIFGISSEIKPGTRTGGEGTIPITGWRSPDKTVRLEPDPFPKEDIEKAAKEWAMTYETEKGRDPKDVSLYNLGYDIESKNLATGEVERYIEVKGASGKPEKREITVNEWREAINKSDWYYIYYVLGLGTDEGEIRIVKNPASKLNPEEKTFNISIPRDFTDEILPIKKKKSE